jgi:hypothetical protein
MDNTVCFLLLAGAHGKLFGGNAKSSSTKFHVREWLLRNRKQYSKRVQFRGPEGAFNFTFLPGGEGNT